MISIKLQRGHDIAPYLDHLATLRLDIFREFPYLYAGKRERELDYLQGYAQAADACVLTVTDAGRVVGAATGMPLQYEENGLRWPFAATWYPLESSYYIGELLLYLPYRQRGLGMELLSLLEDHLRSSGNYRYLTCTTVVRPDDHPLRPANYLPIERFLQRTGFTALSGVMTTFTWRELDGVSRDHQMQFWLKPL